MGRVNRITVWRGRRIRDRKDSPQLAYVAAGVGQRVRQCELVPDREHRPALILGVAWRIVDVIEPRALIELTEGDGLPTPARLREDGGGDGDAGETSRSQRHESD